MFALFALVLAAEPASENIRAAVSALADFRPEDAVVLLERAKDEGPHIHADHVLLYEQLGVAYAYLDRAADAERAFQTMLALDPSGGISYTLSPKVTFLFEAVRKKSNEQPRPSLDVSWPRDIAVDRPVPLVLEIVADPLSFLSTATIYFRLKGSPRWSEKVVSLTVGAPTKLELPAPAPLAVMPQVLELYVISRDQKGNEVLLFESERRPRELALAYEPPEPWYSQWWVWAAAGTVVAASAGALVFAVTREPPSTVEGSFQVIR